MNAARDAPPKLNLPDRPLALYRDIAARHRAAAVGLLLRMATSPSLQQVGVSLRQIAAGSPLVKASFKDAGPASIAALAEINATRRTLIEDNFGFDLAEDWPHLIVDDYAAALR